MNIEIPLKAVLKSFSWSICWNSVGCKKGLCKYKHFLINSNEMLDERMWQNVIQDLNPTESRKIQIPLHILQVQLFNLYDFSPYICPPNICSPFICRPLYMLTLYMRYILLIPRLTKEHCNNPNNQTLPRFNPSIKRDGGGSRVLKQNSCKKFIC